MAAPRSPSPLASILASVTGRIRERTLPAATYRLQLSKDFSFDQAAAVVPYLHQLGITHLYLSPYLRAATGSAHGYDVVAHDEVSAELGGREGLERLVQVLRAHEMGHILDFVPNHMGICNENELWQDVLENGPSSVYARFFDIVWKPVQDQLENKVLLPVLGDQYGAVLEAGELRLAWEGGAFFIRYYDHRFPINPRQFPNILLHRIETLRCQFGDTAPELEELLSICTACNNLPARTETDPERIVERRREKEVIKRRLDQLCATNTPIREFIEENVAIFNGSPGDPRSFDRLDELLDEQCYRLAHWRVAGEEINYRRFFDINDLAALRMEDPEVFEHSHALVLELLAEGAVQGIRIDHPDGLFDPEAYFRRLQEARFLSLCREAAAELAPAPAMEILEPLLLAARAADPALQRPIYLVAEKILGHDEALPEGWAIDGTTGYDFLNVLAGLFVDRSQKKGIDDAYLRFTNQRKSLEELLYEKKKLILSTSMASEVNILSYLLNRLAQANRRSRDFTLNSLRAALTEYIACFPVYRTYVSTNGVDATDRRYVEQAIARAKRRSPVTNVTIFDFLRDVLLLRQAAHQGEEERGLQLEFAMKLQQLTGPVMAKGLEDTCFYIYNRLIALNEVGGNPAAYGSTVAEFHAANARRPRGSLLATTTHDTKRSEDVRTRILALSEAPAAWRALLSRLSRLARKHRVPVAEDRWAPDANEQVLLYQTLLGAWPGGEAEPEGWEAFVARMESYLVKAAKEAKVNTSWINPDLAWDEGLALFVRRILGDEAVVRELCAFHARLAEVGMVHSLAQTLLKITSCGVPDIYQGSERWCLSLVDPDNRGPVDFEWLRCSLEALQRRLAEAPEQRAALARELWEQRVDGRIKQYITWCALSYRRRHAMLFQEGAYVPVFAAGPRSEHVVALCRRHDHRQVIAAVPRLVAPLLDEAEAGQDPWEKTYLTLPAGSGGAAWRDLLTGAIHQQEQMRQSAVLPLSRLWATLPVALLVPASRETASTQGGERWRS